MLECILDYQNQTPKWCIQTAGTKDCLPRAVKAECEIGAFGRTGVAKRRQNMWLSTICWLHQQTRPPTQKGQGRQSGTWQTDKHLETQ